MARSVVELRINERTARTRLSPRNKPYWRLIAEGFHLGYRRGPRKGTWMARLKVDGDYRCEALGQADDFVPADGTTILSYAQAQELALAWKEGFKVRDAGRAVGAVHKTKAKITVAQAIQTYVARRDVRRTAQAGRPVKSDAHYKLNTHVLADKKLAQTDLRDLTEAHLIAWQGRLVTQPLSSRQRIASDFKAALNAAYAANRRLLPGDLPTVIKYGLHIEAGDAVIVRARENQILTDAQVRDIVAGAHKIDEDFGRLVLLLAATGARFAQLRRVRVGDVQPEQSRVLVPQSFKGKRSHSYSIRVAVGADVIDGLRPVLEGRDAEEPLLERWLVRQISPTRWEPYERGAWKTPSEMKRMWVRLMADLKFPSTTIPYSLRHSSIVRGLRANLPIRLVAALHDTSVAMIERHYARWITDGLEELVARAVVPLFDQGAASERQAA